MKEMARVLRKIASSSSRTIRPARSASLPARLRRAKPVVFAVWTDPPKHLAKWWGTERLPHDDHQRVRLSRPAAVWGALRDARAGRGPRLRDPRPTFDEIVPPGTARANKTPRAAGSDVDRFACPPHPTVHFFEAPWRPQDKRG